MAIALGLGQQVYAETSETHKCDSRESQCEETTGRIRHNSQLVDTAVAENVERVLVRKHFVLHALPDVKPEVMYDEKKIPNELAIREDTTIRFHSGKHFLSAQTKIEIDKIVTELSNKKELKLHFIGHADSQKLSANARKIYRDNQGLSEQRAAAVAEYVRQKLNLTQEVITTEGQSDRVAIASNATPEGMAKNRRVEVLASYVDTQMIQSLEQKVFRRDVCAGKIKPVEGMRITLDGKPMHDVGNINNADEQRCADVALNNLDMQLRFDNHNSTPALNINHALVQSKDNYELLIQGYSNYLSFIDRAELRIFKGQSNRPVKLISLDQTLAGKWLIPEELDGKRFSYRLRVYDKQGRFDETVKKSFRLDGTQLTESLELPAELLSGYGESHLSRQNIPVNGGSLTLSGKNIPEKHNIYFLGRELPITQQRDFVHQQILPANVHRAEVAVLDSEGNGELIYRDIEFVKDDWFYVGLADITLGKNSTSGPIELVTGDTHHFDGDLFVDGRLAFYAKGKVKEKYTITSSVDTREEPLSEIFSNFSAKDPNSLLRRLEEENHFSVYGDDSSVKEDAPTKGKFYFKIEDSQSHLLWGNFQTRFNQTDLTRIERGLYGAQLNWNSEANTSFGEKKTQLDVFAAEADTSAAYEQQRGTGGSLYYLQHQDITQGSERIAIEIRDKDSELVLSRTTLVAGKDYTIDSLQGRILLTRPLASTSSDDLLVRDGGLSGNPTYLVVNYEYTPGFDELDDLTVGGRISHWFGDKVKLGLTATRQDVAEQEQKIAGVDLTYRHSEDSYFKLESAQSDGIALGAQNSNNGGYHFEPIRATNGAVKADAYRFESGLSFADLGIQTQGLSQFYWQQKEAGYNGLGQLTQFDTEQVGAKLTWAISENSDLRLKLDKREEKGGIDRQSAELNFIHDISDSWVLSAGVRNEDLTPAIVTPPVNNNPVSNTNNIGLRTDLTVQLEYSQPEDWSAFVFAQSTLKHDNTRKANDRLGLGGRYQVSNKVALVGEVSSGNLGVGSKIGADYQYSDASNVYLNYELDPDRTDNGIAGRNGELVSGARHRFSDSTSIYGEERYLHGDGQTGLTHAYGVDYAPNERWTFGLAIERGELQQVAQEAINRKALSLSAGYASGEFKYAGAIEYREDKSITESRESWLTRNNFGYKLDPDWRAQLRLDVAISDSSNGNSLNSDFSEALLGFAYRPVDNDRFNALLTYNYLEDLAPSEQFTASGQQNDYQQKSHVFAVDANYDLNSQWTVGGKVARRTGEIRQGRDTGQWFKSTADLFIVRADWHLVKNWDFLVEGRLLEVDLAQEKRSGALVALHRHFGEHVKLGVGYNFTEFSDDLTHLDYDADGWFINFVGKF